MRAIQFEELIPHPAEFTLAINQKTYHLMPLSIADSEWMRAKYGDTIAQRFKLIDIDFICTVVMRLITEKDREDFVRREVKTFNEDTGEEGKILIGGAALFKHMIAGPKEVLDIITACLKTIGMSQPLMDELGKAELEAIAKKKAELLSAGLGSSTASGPTTDGAPSTSSPASP